MPVYASALLPPAARVHQVKYALGVLVGLRLSHSKKCGQDRLSMTGLSIIPFGNEQATLTTLQMEFHPLIAGLPLASGHREAIFRYEFEGIDGWREVYAPSEPFCCAVLRELARFHGGHFLPDDTNRIESHPKPRFVVGSEEPTEVLKWQQDVLSLRAVTKEQIAQCQRMAHYPSLGGVAFGTLRAKKT